MLLQKAQRKHLPQLLALYTHLKENPLPLIDDSLRALWDTILNDPNHHILIGLENDEIISSCVLVVIPNLTHSQRPYALIENVVTHANHRKKGYAGQLLEFAKQIAKENGCYKIMLMTSSKEKSTLDFYKKAGYNTGDKTAFIQWL